MKTNQSLNAAVDQACVNCVHKENNELCMIGYPHNSSKRCQDPKTEKNRAEDRRWLRQDETLFRTANRITLPTARVKQSEWSRLKLPLQTSPGALKLTCLSTKQLCCPVDTLNTCRCRRTTTSPPRTLHDIESLSVAVQYVTPRHVPRCLLLHLREIHLFPRQEEVPEYSHSICGISLVELRVQIEILSHCNRTLIVQLERHCPKMRFETISLVTRLIQIRDT